MPNGIKSAYSFDVSSKSFAEKVFSDKEFVKEAEAAGTLFVQDFIRENGFARKCVTTRPVSASELVEVDFTDQPALIVHNDVDTNAMTVPIRGRGNYRFYDTKKFYVFFEKVVSEKVRKTQLEMMSNSVNYKEIFKKRIAEAMYKVEDMTVIAGAEKCIKDERDASDKAKTTVDNDNYTKSKQSIDFKAGVTLDKDSLVTFFKLPTQNKTKIEKVLLTESLLQEIIRMSMLEVGDSKVSEFWEKGVDNVKQFWGKQIVTTIKNEVVPDNTMFGFAPGELYGWLFILRDHTTYMEVDRDIWTLDSDALISHAIGNTKGVYKATFDI